jgi:hypothetical protein
MILPHFHTSKFEVEEYNLIGVDVAWSLSHAQDGVQVKTKTLFPLKCDFPTVKSLTFDNRHEPMDLQIAY